MSIYDFGTSNCFFLSVLYTLCMYKIYCTYFQNYKTKTKIIISAFQKSWTTSLSGMDVLQYKRHWLALFPEFFYSTSNHFGPVIFGIQQPKLCNNTTYLFVLVFSGFLRGNFTQQINWVTTCWFTTRWSLP